MKLAIFDEKLKIFLGSIPSILGNLINLIQANMFGNKFTGLDFILLQLLKVNLIY